MQSNSKIRLALILTLGAMLYAGCAGRSALPSSAFEGTISQTIHLDGLGELIQSQRDSSHSDSTHGESESEGASGLLGMAASTVNMKIYVKEDKVAYEIEALGGFLKIRSIIDRSQRTLTTILPMGKAIVTNLRMMDTLRRNVDDSLRAHHSVLDSLAMMVPQPTGKKATMHGFDVEEYRSSVKGLDVVLWLTTDPRMKFYDVIRDAFLGRRHTGMGGIEQLFGILAPISGGKVPVKTEISSKGKVLISSEMSDIKEEKVDEEIFQIPKDDEIVNGDSLFTNRRHRHRMGEGAPEDSSSSDTDRIE